MVSLAAAQIMTEKRVREEDAKNYRSRAHAISNWVNERSAPHHNTSYLEWEELNYDLGAEYVCIYTT